MTPNYQQQIEEIEQRNELFYQTAGVSGVEFNILPLAERVYYFGYTYGYHDISKDQRSRFWGSMQKFYDVGVKDGEGDRERERCEISSNVI